MEFPRDFSSVDHQEIWLPPPTLGKVDEAQMVSVDLQRTGGYEKFLKLWRGACDQSGLIVVWSGS